MNSRAKSDKSGGYYLSCTLKHNKAYHVHLLPDDRWTKKKVDHFKSAQQNALDIYDLAGYNENDYCP